MHKKMLLQAGASVENAERAVIMVHGRGASAEDIISLANHLEVADYAIVAPQATNGTWYPLPFMNPVERNEPWLSSALDILASIVADFNKAGISDDRIYFAGFSQGACLGLEFASRNARRWGGVAAFSGALIGETLNPVTYKGDFAGTPVFVGTSDPDPYFPVSRVQESVELIRTLGAEVEERIYKNMGHTISQEELELANKFVFEK